MEMREGIIEEMRQIRGMRCEVGISSQGNEGDRMAIEEDQDRDPWSLLVDLNT
jgi:hypothetical protein